MEINSSKPRFSWLDALRGFALLCIVYGHASRDVGLLAKAVYSFHVPLCVFITGYLYEWKDNSLKYHLKKSGQRLLIPYLIWSLISIGIYMVLGKLAAGSLEAEVYSLKENLIFMVKGLSIGNAPLWYLPFLFTLQLLVFFLFHMLKKQSNCCFIKKSLMILGPFLFSILTLLLYSKYQYTYPIDLPFGINNACFLLGFFWAGYLIRKYSILPSGKRFLTAGIFLVFISIFLAMTFNDEVSYMSFDHSEYGRNTLVFYGTSLAACLGFFWIFRNLGELPLLQWFGRNAMAIFLMHKFPVLLFQVLLGNLRDKTGFFWFLLPLGISLVSMVLCCAAAHILRHFLPWTIGEYRKAA